MRTKIFEALEFYKKEGIRMFPLQPGEKRPINKWKEYINKEMADEEIQEYFIDNDYNLGVICAQESNGFFCLDFDSKELFERFFEKKDGLVIVESARGYHAYFRSDKEIKTLKCFSDAGAEILTLKGQNTYMVAAGSKHPSGVEYKFIRKGKIPTLSGNVREDIKARATSLGLNFGANEKGEDIDIKTLLNGVVQGGRDTACTYIIHYLRRQNTSYTDAYEILKKWNNLNNPPILENELYEKVNYHYNLPEAYKFFYVTNPVQYVITPDLQLKSVIEVTPPIAIEDVLYIDEKNRECIDEEKLLAFIDFHITFKCVSDTKELLLYKNGIYVDELGTLDTFLELHLSTKASIRFKAEIRKHIQDRNSIDREEINKDKIRIPVKNGLLNLDTHLLEPFTKDKIYTSALNATYDREATARKRNTAGGRNTCHPRDVFILPLAGISLGKNLLADR
jgi:hypothetical protein